MAARIEAAPALDNPRLTLKEYKKAAFEKFKQKKYLSIGGRDVEIVEIPPFLGSIPEGRIGFDAPSTNVLLPGFATSQETYQEAIIEAALRGGYIFALTQPREESQTIFVDSNYPREANQRAEAAIALIQHAHATTKQKINLIGLSFGAIDSVLAVQQNPEPVKNMALVFPAGMIGEVSPDTLTRRGKSHALQAAWDIASKPITAIKQRALIATTINETIKYIWSDNELADREIAALSQIQIDGLLPEIRAKGISVIGIFAVHDTLFPVEVTQKKASTKQNNAKRFDGVYVVRGGHGSIDPSPSQIVPLLIHSFNKIDQHRASGLTIV